MNWRPDDWDKIRIEQSRNCNLVDFESGAEAMLAARDKWWIERVGEDIVEVFLNVPMNDANKETLLKTWQRLKKESEEK
jgi:hypothetical protein